MLPSGYLELIEGEPDATVAVIAHGGVVLAGLRVARSLGPRDPWLTDAVIPLASITEIEFTMHPEAECLVRIVRVSDCSHLAD